MCVYVCVHLICWVCFTWDVHVLALGWLDQFGAIYAGRVSVQGPCNILAISGEEISALISDTEVWIVPHSNYCATVVNGTPLWTLP